MTDASNNLRHRALIVTAGAYRCALPLPHVAETMRPLPLQSFADMPPFVRGASIIRGEPVPVVDLAGLFGAADSAIGRFVVVRVEQRRVALGVEAVVGGEDL